MASRPLSIMDLGSMAIGGSYRSIFDDPAWTYTGVDLAPGENVDLVLSDPYNWLEIETGSFDVVISGQAFEHIEFFWKTMQEICRVLKPGGLCCIIAPSSGPEHKYPVDCWRFYPDGFRALAKYVGLETLEVDTEWNPGEYEDGSHEWKDTFFVGRKPSERGGAKEDQDRQGLHVYRREVRVEEDDSLAKIVRYVREGARVLELGPATGYLTRFLSRELGCTVDCVEKSPEMAREAARFSRLMKVGDLEQMDLAGEFQEGFYDFVIAADVLEHLDDPVPVLEACRKLLKGDGRLVLSMPNIAHVSIIGELLKGRFEYAREGILDRTHKRFYTRSTIEELLHGCGFSLESQDQVIRLPEDTEFRDSLAWLPHEVQKVLFNRPDALVYQFVMVACPSADVSKKQVVPKGYECSVVDLRLAVIMELQERLQRTEKALSEVQASVQEYIRRLEEALAEAQGLAHERLDYIHTLESALEDTKQLAIERLEAIGRLKSRPLVRAALGIHQLMDRLKGALKRG